MSNSYLIELERLRALLVEILDNKGITVTADEQLNSLIPKVNAVGIAELAALLSGTNTEINDVLGEIVTINKPLFRYAKSATKLILPECLTIGGNAFYENDTLNEIYIPKATSIGANAFYTCNALSKLEIGKGNTAVDVGSYAFQHCIALQELIIEGTISLHQQSFYLCSGLKKVDIGTIGTSDGASHFNGCTSLEKIKIGSVGTLITNNFAFGCTSLKLIDIGYAATIASASSFLTNCNNFKAFVLQSNTGVPTTLSSSNIFDYPVNNELDFGIYVLYSEVATYQALSNWSNVSTYIKSIQENLATLIPLDFDYTNYVEIVDELPTSDISTTKVYWIETATEGTYEQWFYGSGSWAQLADITL